MRRLAIALIAGCGLGLVPGFAFAQDVEALSALRGIPLPAAYFETVRRNPQAFELPNGLFRASAAGPALAEGITGTARIPVVLALFADSPEPHITPAQVRASLFDGPAPTGTLTASYEEMSRGRFRVTGDVFPWVRTNVTLAQAVGNSNGLGGTAQVGQYLTQAIARVDATVDFGRYDNEGPDGVPNSGDDDGVVDAVAFEFLEIAASCGGPGIWPHRSGISSWSGQPYTTGDRRPSGTFVQVNGYIIQSVADCSGREVQTASTIAHEFGHVLGLPDFYHVVGGDNRPQFRRWVLGCWELMAAGSWGCGPVTERESFGPTHMLAAQKFQLGWVELEDVGQVWDREYVLEPIQQSGRALRVPLDTTGLESLVIEYRTRTGFDRSLPGEGVLITHWDRGGALRPRLGLRYLERVLEADWNDGLVRITEEGGNRGEAGDAFGASGGISRLNAFTNPPLLRQATGGTPTTVAIHSITVSGGQARIRLSTAPTPRVMASGATLQGGVARSLETRLRIAGGVMPYSVLGVTGGPPGLAISAQEDELLVRGLPGAAGSFQMIVRLGDSRGSGFEATLPVSVQTFFVEQERLLQGFLKSEVAPLEAGERGYLDQAGNANGALDVGDVRAWLLRAP
jgi:M6 family metalloprotease-like protein